MAALFLTARKVRRREQRNIDQRLGEELHLTRRGDVSQLLPYMWMPGVEITSTRARGTAQVATGAPWPFGVD